MLVLSDVLLELGDEITSFVILTETIQTQAIEKNELFFTIDIEPPAYLDRPSDWHDQLNIAFESAR